MKTLLITLLLSISIFGQSGKNVWSQALEDSVRQAISDSLNGHSGTVNVSDSLHYVTPQMFGAIGNGVAEDSLAFQTALQYLYDNGGGTLYIPKGTYLISSQFIIPHSDSIYESVLYRNQNIKIIGDGNFAQSSGVADDVHGGTILKLAYNGSKDYLGITYGTGTLSFEGLTFYTEVASKSFFKIVATTTYINNCTFYGAASGTSASNDCILLGGTYTTDFLTDSSAFQGYGTTIKDNYFYKVRRAVLGGTYCNGVVIKDNTVWNNCGSNVDSVAVIELRGTSISGDSGNLISGNLIEANNYFYAIKLAYAYNNSIVYNSIWDTGGSAKFKAVVRLQEYATYNYISLSAYYNVFSALSEDSTSLNKNTFITASMQIASKFTEQIDIYNQINFKSVLPSKFYYDTYRYWDYFLQKSGSYYLWSHRFIDSTTQYIPFQIAYYPNTLTTLTLGKEGYITTLDGDLRLKASGNNSVWLGQDNLMYVNAGRLFSNITTGTSPFNILSTTPVDNLTVKRIYEPTFLGKVQTDLDINGNTLDNIGSLNIALLQSDTTGLDAGETYVDPLTNILYMIRGADLVVNGGFTDWALDNPDNWIHSVEDVGNYVTENPTDKLNFVTDGTFHAWTVYQTVCDSGNQYGYSFEVVSASANDSIIVAIGGNNYNITSTGIYSGTITAYSQNIAIRNEDNAVNFIFDNFKVWLITGGTKQAPIYVHNEPYVNNFPNPTLADTLSIFRTDKLLTIDSIQVRTDDSVGVKGTFGALGLGTTIFNADTINGGWETITTFNDATIDAGNEVYFYFTYIGDTTTFIRWKIYWRE